jgi:hypothetical protein
MLVPRAVRFSLSWFYVPSLKDFAANVSVYIFLLVLAGVLHYFTDVPEKIMGFLNPRSPSVSASILLLAIGFCLNFMPIFFAIDNYYMNWRQTARAAVGTTVCVCLLYTLLWKTFESGLPHWHSFVSPLNAGSWRKVLRLVMSGSLISVVTSFKLGFSGNLEAFDFKDLRRYGVVWKHLVKTLETEKKLNGDQHAKIKKATTSILEQLRSGGRMQPSVVEKAKGLGERMREFEKWYDDETKPGFVNLVGLKPKIVPTVSEIRKLC